MMKLRIPAKVLASMSAVTLTGCAHLGFGPTASESRSELLTFPVVHSRFHESRLPSGPSDPDVIRVTWLPAFEPPFLVRLDHHPDGTATEIIKQLSGTGGYTPGHLTRQKARSISVDRFETLSRQLNASGFWSAPRSERGTLAYDSSDYVTDGPVITVEARVRGRYHQITRYAPFHNARERRLTEFLFNATADYHERPIIRLPWLR